MARCRKVEDFRGANWKAEFLKMRKSNTKKLLKQKKLILILDLDQTLLHSRAIGKVSPAQDSSSSSSSSLFRVDSVSMMTKLRPYARTFLQEASTMFEMYVYTMGTRGYAIAMTKLLDPGGDIFRQRVITREECSRPKQKGLDVVFAEERVVVILDDTKEVWKRHTKNLVQIDRYDFFGRQRQGDNADNAEGTSSASEFTKSDESEEDGALARTLGVLKKIHCMFFDRDIIAEPKRLRRDTRDVLKKIREGQTEEKKGKGAIDDDEAILCLLALHAS